MMKKTHKTVYKTLILSNFMVMLVAVIVAVLGYSGYNQLSLQQAADYNQVILRQIRSSFDEKMKSINKLILDITSNSQVSGLTLSTGEISSEDRFRSVQVMQTLGNYVSIYNFLDSIFIYYPASDRVISSSASYSSTEMFMKNADCAYWSTQEWESLFSPTTRYLHDGNVLSIISPITSRSGPFIVVNVKGEFIKELFENTRSLEDNLIAVQANATGETLFCVGNQALSPLIGASGTVEAGGASYTIESLPSRESDWTYYFILPENAFLVQMNDTLIVGLTALLLAGGTCICFILARQNSIPIRKLAYRISHQMGMWEEKGQNELELISQASEQAICAYQNMHKIVERYRPVLRSRLLQQLFYGAADLEHLSSQDVETMGISFPYRQFYLALISVRQPAGGGAAGYLAGPRITEYIEKLYARERVCCAEVEMGRIALLVNTEEYREEDAAALLRKVNEFVYRQFGVEATAALACMAEGEPVSQTYVRCVRALERQLIRYPGEIVSADEKDRENEIYYYPAETEMQLIESVKAGNLKNVNRILDTVIVENFIHNSLTLESSKCLFFNLMGTAIKIVGAIGSKPGALEDEIACYQKIIACEDIQDMEATLREFFYNICVYINAHSQKGEELIDRLVEHISQNSDDQNLSLQSVASAFGINANYLSGYFKEQTGENFLPFVQHLRLDNAKRLLAETSLPVHVIATRVGYSGDAVFIRNFKKYTGCTPGRFREQAREADGH